MSLGAFWLSAHDSTQVGFGSVTRGANTASRVLSSDRVVVTEYRRKQIELEYPDETLPLSARRHTRPISPFLGLEDHKTDLQPTD